MLESIMNDTIVKSTCALGKKAVNRTVWIKVTMITEMIRIISDDFHFIVHMSKSKNDKFIRYIDTLYNNSARWIRETKQELQNVLDDEESTEDELLGHEIKFEIVEQLEHQCAVFCKLYEEWSYPDWKNKNKEMIAAYYNLDENIMNNISSYMFY